MSLFEKLPALFIICADLWFIRRITLSDICHWNAPPPPSHAHFDSTLCTCIYFVGSIFMWNCCHKPILLTIDIMFTISFLLTNKMYMPNVLQSVSSLLSNFHAKLLPLQYIFWLPGEITAFLYKQLSLYGYAWIRSWNQLVLSNEDTKGAFDECKWIQYDFGLRVNSMASMYPNPALTVIFQQYKLVFLQCITNTAWGKDDLTVSV